tara:strand:+ start:1574 stop:2533 length:960 start_codon:yes stop_codon:yes gene_type:complete
MANVLVTGGAGYVGGALTERLMLTQHNVRVYDSLLYEESYRKQVPFALGDVRDHRSLEPHLEWADVVVCLAGIVGDGACALDPEMTLEINRDTVARLAEEFDGRIIFMSTCSVYGAAEGILDEESPLSPLSIYAESKLEAEECLKDSNAIIFRLGTLFGIGDLFSRIRMDLVVNVLTARAFTRGKVKVFGGEQYRPLLHVRDVAEAITQNIDTDHRGIYNLHANNMKIGDLADHLKTLFPDLKIEKTPMKFEDSRNYRVSSERAKNTFGFNPILTVDDGIEELQRLLIEGRVKELGITRHSNYLFLKESLEQEKAESWI